MIVLADDLPTGNKIGGHHMEPIRFAHSPLMANHFIPTPFFGNWHDVDMMAIDAAARIPIVTRAEMITKKYVYIS